MWLYIAVAAVLVFLIAALVTGREARRLDAVAPRAVYQVDQAVAFVVEVLPDQTKARLTMDELEQLLILHMKWLHERGLQPDAVIDRRQNIDTPVVVTEEALIAFLLGEAENAGVALLDDVDVVNVVDAHLAYFDAIGAVGPSAADV
ncbi:MAG: hypothetical protein B7C54_03545 [Acidimicrobiales bacterium mtb01]|nr:hypothetical protein [Actinomycetota bacterium]TEX47365.1 MAG: hypothetical protein B7C54_03545 [Acidimicrobiales bacterium mtb01]